MKHAAAMSRLGLGTAQFGLGYGITNIAGKLPQSVVTTIISDAAAAGIHLLDTAHLYGDSEAVIGRSGYARSFRIITKTPKFVDCRSESEAVARLRRALACSQARLRRARIDGLLIHDCDDLLGPYGAAIWEEMEAARTEGIVERIGASIYEGAQIDAASAQFPLQIIQIPWSPVDRRLESSGRLRRLSSEGIEIHARSLFLQGLLLEPVDRISGRFAGLAEAIAQLDTSFTRLGLSRLEGILAVAFREEVIARFLFGVASRAHLKEVLAAAAKAETVKQNLELPFVATLDERVLNPSRWPELAK